MAKVMITESYLEDIADAIRAQLGGSDTYKPGQMATAIASIGGGGTPTIDSLSVTPSESTQTFNSSSVDGYKPVTVAGIPLDYVGSGIDRRDSTDLSASGATVSVPAGYYESATSKSVTTMTLPTSTAASATSGYTLKATVSRSTSDQYINIAPGYNSAGGYYKISAVANGSATAPATISGTSATISTGSGTLTLTKTVSVTPSVTAGYVSSGTAGNSSVSLTASVTTKGATTYHPSTTAQSISSGTYLTGIQTINAVTTSNLTADNIKSGVTVKVGDSSDDDCVTSITGTYSGGGGSSKNIQVLQSTSRSNSSSLTKVLGDLTVSTTGTYDIYWSGGRTNTSSSYTWGTRLYVDGSGYGTENTTWTNNCQSNHLSNVSLTANQKLSVYSRGRSGSYYTFVPMLVIVES